MLIMRRDMGLLPVSHGSPVRWFALGLLCCAGLFGQVLAQDKPGAEAEKKPAGERIGRLIRVRPSIEARRVGQEATDFIARVSKTGKQPVLIFQIEPGQWSFGDADDLAREILKLAGASTVAFIAQPEAAEGQRKQAPNLSGHAVLVALACEQLALPADAFFGQANAGDDQPSPAKRAAYEEIAKARRAFPEDLAVAFVDPTVEIIEAETADKKRLFLAAQSLARLKETQEVAARRKLVPAGKTAWFQGQELADLGLVRSEHLVGDRGTLARGLGLRPEELEEDPFFGTAAKAAMFPIVDEKTLQRAKDKIQGRIKGGVNLVFLEIDSIGGVEDYSAPLAKYLSELQPSTCRTVAVIRKEAAGDAALIAAACDHILMLPDASLGGEGRLMDAKNKIDKSKIAMYATKLADAARAKGRNPSLAAALIDREAIVHRYVGNAGQEYYFSEAELEREPNPRIWQRKEEVTVAGAPLVLSGKRALDLRMATAQIESLDELKDRYGLTSDPPRAGPDWVDSLVDFLKQDWIQMILLTIGFVALYAEMNTPGHGVGGFIATVCFLLFFWANIAGGSADWLEILLFLAGIVMLLIELFVLPGFGIVGLGGIILILLSMVMAMQTFQGIPQTQRDMLELRHSLTTVTLSAIGALLLGVLVRRFLPRTHAMSDLILASTDGANPQLTGAPDALGNYQYLIGQTGQAMTQLTPSGKARIGDQMVDVVTEGDVVAKGAHLVVVETHGNRIVVRPT